MSEPLRWEDSGGGIVVEASAYDAVVAECEALQRQVDEQAKALRDLETMFAAVVASGEGHTVLVDKRLLERVEGLERFSHPITGTPVFRAVLGRADA